MSEMFHKPIVMDSIDGNAVFLGVSFEAVDVFSAHEHLDDIKFCLPLLYLPEHSSLNRSPVRNELTCFSRGSQFLFVWHVVFPFPQTIVDQKLVMTKRWSLSICKLMYLRCFSLSS